ncbi:MAG: hypothetical protein H8E34_01830 [Bacteroidetes bacterium]|nr:hypothetical protein [Bacteroidota bacterium]MBL6944134.1 hypothetical protein [Bacteroidales bacterium]
MKKITTTILLFALFSNPKVLISQGKCKVLLASISETYEGKCKKGLAVGIGIATGIDKYDGRFRQGYPHGKGTYTWASGDEYIGEWDYGKRQGVGTYIFSYSGKDSIQTGIWKDDRYTGPVPPPPNVIRSYNLQKYSFRKLGDLNKLSIEIYMNGTINSTIENLRIFSSNGSYQNIGQKIVFDNIFFPATFKITYVTWNKLHTAKHEVIFEFEIYEQGDWLLKLTN